MRATLPSHTVPSPFPFPPPEPPGPRAPLPLPMVAVAATWEYRHLYRAFAGEQSPLPAAELAALGADGWELAAAVPGPGGVHFYFKRAPA